MPEIVKYGNILNLLPMPELKAKEMDIFMQILSKMQFADKRELVFDGYDFFKELKKSPQNKDHSFPVLFEAFDNFADKILDYKIQYYDAKNNVKYAFVCFDRLKFDFNTSQVVIRAQDDFYNAITNYKLGFTRFELLEFAGLSSTYTKILYRLLKQFRTTGVLSIKIEEFKRILQIPDSYRMCDIDEQVLKPSIKELTRERDLFNQRRVPFKNLKVEKIKGVGRGRGGYIKSLKFTFRKENLIEVFNKTYKGVMWRYEEHTNVLYKIKNAKGEEPRIILECELFDLYKAPIYESNDSDKCATKTFAFKTFDGLEKFIEQNKIDDDFNPMLFQYMSNQKSKEAKENK